jgi:hypothetical protein
LVRSKESKLLNSIKQFTAYANGVSSVDGIHRDTTFTRLVSEFIDDENYAKLQISLAKKPGSGKVIPGGGGIRKLRWAGSGKGKRGGLRIIYYWRMSANQIWMLFAYPKNEQEGLDASELKELKWLVKQLSS